MYLEPQLDLNKRYSYADYFGWVDDVRRELIDGFIKMMSPAPARKHQGIVSNIGRHFGNYLHKKPCKVYFSPFDVRLPKNGEKEDKKLFTVVQPDICIICDPSKLDDRGCLGAPDLIVEIVSPSSLHHDTVIKHKVYEDAGVKEYWIIFPGEQVVEVFKLVDQKFQLRDTYSGNVDIPVGIFNDELTINLPDVFLD